MSELYKFSGTFVKTSGHSNDMAGTSRAFDPSTREMAAG